jgi:UDP-N-acetylmuramate dehydrogenase
MVMVHRISKTLEKINCTFPLRAISTIGCGPKEVSCLMPTTEEELKEAIAYIRTQYNKFPVILGLCSNLLVSEDPSFNQPFLSLIKLKGKTRLGSAFTAFAGEGLHDIVADSLCFTSDMTGLSGIPGTIGGAVVGNAGAEGTSISDLVESVKCIDLNGAFHTLTRNECDFKYRSSIFQQRELIVTEVRFHLHEGDSSQARKLFENAIRRRKERGIGLEPSLGSFFRNPSSIISAGKLMDQAGLKGMSIGKAKVSQHHANILVNPQRMASSAEVAALAKYCHKTILNLYGINLKPEVVLYGLNI